MEQQSEGSERSFWQQPPRPDAAKYKQLIASPSSEEETQDEAQEVYTRLADLEYLTLHQIAREGRVKLLAQCLVFMDDKVKKHRINEHDEEDLSPLHYAAKANCKETSGLLLLHGADVHDKDGNGDTPLHFAARYKLKEKGPVEALEEAASKGPEQVLWADEKYSAIPLLVSTGAKVNAQDYNGSTPLHFAAMRGNASGVRQLLNCKGIHIDATDRQTMTPLHVATSHNEKDICAMLIQRGANIRCCDQNGSTPLHYACREGNLPLVKILFKHAAECGDDTVYLMLKDSDKYQNTALHLAVERNFLDVVKILVRHADEGIINALTCTYQTPLHIAARTGNKKIAEILAERKARLDALDISLESPLYKAAAHDKIEVLKYLIAKKAGIYKRDKDCVSPFLIAARYGHIDVAKLILKKANCYMDEDKFDRTALYWAAQNDNRDFISKVLMEYDEEAWLKLLDHRDRHYNSSLHVASKNGHVECAKLLFGPHGKYIYSKNDNEQTPLHLAAKHGKTQMVITLLDYMKTHEKEYGAQVKKRTDESESHFWESAFGDINVSVTDGDYESIPNTSGEFGNDPTRKSLKNIVNDKDEDGNTPLHLAAIYGHEKVAEILLQNGADVEVRNSKLWTPLDCAASEGQLQLCSLFLRAGALVDPVDKVSESPLHWACSEGHTDVANLFLNSGANPGLRRPDGKNCLDLAIDHYHKDVALAIINSEKWESALRNDEIQDGVHTTPMRKLIKRMPEVARKVLDKCISRTTADYDHPDHEVTFNFEFIDDTYANWKEGNPDTSEASGYDHEGSVREDALPYTQDTNVLKNNHPLMVMVKAEREKLLKHPTVTAVMRVRWLTYGLYSYIINLSLYAAYVLFLTGYIMVAKPPYMLFDPQTSVNGLHCSTTNFSSTVNTPASLSHKIFIDFGKWVIIAIAAGRIFCETVAFINSPMNYLREFLENSIQLFTYISSVLLVLDYCPAQTNLRMGWQWQIGSIAIFLTWMTLVLFLQRMDWFGIQVRMFINVFLTFVKFLPIFFLFVFAFALSFYALLQNQTEFDTFSFSLLKTAVMMTGEIDYGSIFGEIKEQDDKYSPESFQHWVFYYPATIFIFVLFVMIMTLIIMNLLVGLAVDDIQAVQSQSELQKIALQVELVLDVGPALPMRLKRKFQIKSLTISPNKRKRRGCCWCCDVGISDRYLAMIVAEQVHHDPIDSDKADKHQDEKDDSIAALQKKISDMGQKQEKVEAMLEAIVQAFQVPYQTKQDAKVETPATE